MKQALVWIYATPKRLAAAFAANAALAATVFHIAEDQSLWDGVWWMFVTASTTGYGDFFPVTVLGRSAAIELMFATALLMLGIGAHIVKHLMPEPPDMNQFAHDEQEFVKAKLSEIDAEADTRFNALMEAHTALLDAHQQTNARLIAIEEKLGQAALV